MCRPPRPGSHDNLSATVAMVVMEPAAGLMEVAPLPALNRVFTRYSLQDDPCCCPPPERGRHRKPAHEDHPVQRAAASLALAGAAQAGAPLRISLTADIRSTEPGVNRDSNSDAVVLHIVEGLVAYGEDAEVRLLAQSVDISPDGTTYTFTLRDGIRFHNGAPLTSADVLWSWQRDTAPPPAGAAPAIRWPRRGQVLSVQAPDPRTVVYRLERPSSLFLATLARTDCGGTGIVHRDSVSRTAPGTSPSAPAPSC